MYKAAALIVDKRKLILLLIGILLLFSFVSRNWVEVEQELTEYLPASSETRQGLDLMEEQFVTFGTADLMIANIDYAEADATAERIRAVKGVQSVDFDDSTDHYNNVSALYHVTFDYPEEDERCLEVLQQLKDRYSSMDLYVSTELGNQKGEIIDREVGVIMILVAIIVVTVLTLTSQTYAEVPVLALTFVAAMVLNQGTNFLLGKISFVSDSVTSILQLALSLDYAVILCNRFKEEYNLRSPSSGTAGKEEADRRLRDSVVSALAKGITEIGASSLTTIGGLVAMIFMQFRLGADMGICLIKAIGFALFSVFFFMPCLLMLFGPLMERTRHKSFIPKIPFVGRFAYATRHFIPVLFVGLVIAAYHFSGFCPYVYGYESIVTPKQNEMQIADSMIRANFTSPNYVAMVVPSGDYEKEAELLRKLEEMPQVDHAVGLANTIALDGHTLTERLTPRAFAELADIDYELAQAIYAAYAADHEAYGKLMGGLSGYSVPLIDMFLFVCEELDEGYVTLDEEKMEDLHEARDRMINGQKQLQGPDYSRMLVYLTLPVSSEETYAFTDTLSELAQSFYPDQRVYVVGESTNEYEFQKTFSRDNIVVSVLSILIVLIVLLFTFQSVGMPILLILVIQGSIWINFTIPAFTHVNLFFIAYLIVSSIQMGANIDYAIVIASRYMELKDRMEKKEAIIETMNFAFPTIITSGTILAVAGFLIGRMTSEGSIVGIGESLGRGTVISILLVMFVLPQILLLGAGVIEKTSFRMRSGLKRHRESGLVVVDGVVSGEIRGKVTGVMKATVDGEVNLTLLSGSVLRNEEKKQGKEVQQDEKNIQ